MVEELSQEKTLQKLIDLLLMQLDMLQKILLRLVLQTNVR
ncbi:Uncharacterised protein [Clostridioides difficile]|nr:Uncharacterised protein [Clostridioides difficile]